MLAVRIIAVGNLKERFFTEAAGEYLKRLCAFCSPSVVELAEPPDTAAASAAAPILAALHSRAYKIALCVEGEELDSEAFAGRIERASVSGYPAVEFVIGGSNGLPEQVKKACDLRLSFSRMTYPHRLMRVILLEQIYRAFTIINGKTYHK